MYTFNGMRSWNFHAGDLEEMVRFYREVLGAEEVQRQNLNGTAVARLRIGDTGIGLFDASKSEFPGVPHHTFRFEGPGDPEIMIDELEKKGVKVERSSAGERIRRHGEGPGYSLYVTDPGGNRLELSTDPA
jgi:catechol 2,3-dioxygenase-like lactoylglutathione lyase family enzyme